MTSTLALLGATLIVAFPLASHAQLAELRALQVQYDNQLIDQVTDVYYAGLANLDDRYLAGLERDLTDAKAAGDLETALALEAEKKRLATKGLLPVNDDQAAKPLRKLRGIYRLELAKLEVQRATNKTALLTPYLAKLKQLEIDLTRADRLVEAKTVMDYRQGVAAGVPMKVAVMPVKTEAQPVQPLGEPVKPAVEPPSPATETIKPAVVAGKATFAVAVASTKVEITEKTVPADWDAMLKNPAAVEVIHMEAKPLAVGEGKDTWLKVPQKLTDNKATIFMPAGQTNGVADFTVTADGWLLVGVNYSYQGNNGGDWQKERWEIEKFKAEGWQQIGKDDAGGLLIKNDNRPQEIFAKKVKKGDTQRLRCNKYDPPFLIILGGK